MTAPKPDAVKAVRDVGVSRVLFGPPSSNPEKLKAGMEQIANAIAKL
jgi:hypothetical protein